MMAEESGIKALAFKVLQAASGSKAVSHDPISNKPRDMRLRLRQNLRQTVPARVRGQDAVTDSASAEVCWHCHGEKKCRCAFCAVPGQEPLSWEPGPCGACFATGFLTWPETVQ